MHAAQQWAIEANKGKQNLELPSEYRRHRGIFSEEGASRFPLARPDDLVIKLKLGAPETMNTKIYPMSQSELMEWRAFMKKNIKMKRIKESKSRWAAPVFFIKRRMVLSDSYKTIGK
jgi:hypothetical protein